MSIPTCAVVCRIDGQDGLPIVGATVSAQLDRYEVHEGYVVPDYAEATTDAAGLATLNLWPNALGSTESSYTVRIDTPKGKPLKTRCVVPNTDTVLLHEIADLPAYDGKPDGQLAADAAAVSAAAAQDAQGAAQTSASQAQASATAAQGSATAAAASKAAAAQSESNAAASSASAADSQAGAELAAAASLTHSQTSATHALEAQGYAEGAATFAGAAGAAASAAVDALYVENVAALRALQAPVKKCLVNLAGYYTPGDGGGGTLLWVPASTKTDNRGTVFTPSSSPANGRWERGAYNVSVRWFGARGNGVDDDTAAIQAAIDAVYAALGGAVLMPDGAYSVAASALSETYNNAGAPISASTCSIVLRKGVSLIGSGRSRCRITTTLKTQLIIAMVAPDTQSIEGIEIAGAWNMGDSGAGHGIFVLGTENDADVTCRRATFRDLYIHNVASYGIGLQAGCPTGCRIENVDVEATGADGLDLKARSDVATPPEGNFVSNVTIRNHGLRVTGSCGIDMRGVWHVSGAVVTDFGGNPALSYGGIRFRTKPPVTDAYNKAGARSSLTGFYIRAGAYTGTQNIDGVISGSDDVHVTNGYVDSCTNGVFLTGNTNGVPTRNVFANISAVNSLLYGFQIGADCDATTFSNCSSTGAATAGFRDAGTNTTLIGCRANEATPISTATASAPTQRRVACSFGEANFIAPSSASGAAISTATGTDANIDYRVVAAGTGGFEARARGTRAFRADNPDSAVNWAATVGAIDGGWIAYGVAGTSSNIPVRLRPKGSSNSSLADSNGAEKVAASTNGVGFHGSNPMAKPAITGSRGGNAALASLLTQLASYGLITDSTTA